MLERAHITYTGRRAGGVTRDAIFRKITNRNQANTNEIATTETKYETDFYSSEKIPIFNQILYM